MAADAFFAAFRIPNLLRDLFAEGALSSAFVPVFKDTLLRGGKQEAFELAQVIFTVLTVVLSAVIIVGTLLSPFLVRVIAFGFADTPGKAELTTRLTVMMFPFLLLVAVAALAMSILNSFDRFGVPALAPALFNMGSIAAAYLICPFLKEPIVGMAWGVLLGGLGQFAIQLPGLHRIGFRFRVLLNFRHDGLKRVMKLMLPMISGLAAGRVNIFVNTLLASLLAAGSVSYLTYSFRIMHLPLGMIAVALGTVALPKASEQAAVGDSVGITRTFYRAIHLCFFLVFPVAAFFIACGTDIVALLFQHGKFGPEDTVNTYRALNWYSLGLIGFAGVRVTAPVYYALKDAVRPMRYSIVSVIVNLAGNLVFIPFFDFAGLAAATALGGIINFALLLYHLPLLVKEIRHRQVMGMFLRSVASSTVVGLGLYLLTSSRWLMGLGNHFSGRIARLGILFVIGVGGYFAISYVVRNIPPLRSRKESS